MTHWLLIIKRKLLTELLFILTSIAILFICYNNLYNYIPQIKRLDYTAFFDPQYYNNFKMETEKSTISSRLFGQPMSEEGQPIQRDDNLFSEIERSHANLDSNHSMNMLQEQNTGSGEHSDFNMRHMTSSDAALGSVGRNMIMNDNKSSDLMLHNEYSHEPMVELEDQSKLVEDMINQNMNKILLGNLFEKTDQSEQSVSIQFKDEEILTKKDHKVPLRMFEEMKI